MVVFVVDLFSGFVSDIMKIIFCSSLLLLSLFGDQVSTAEPPPHIIFFLADDMGWNDVSFHGSEQIPTYNIDALGYNGVVLHRHYVQPTCTPSRAALLTGKYPVHTGMHTPLASTEKNGLNVSEKILPQYLKELGYATHIVGKWHLGFHEKSFTPLERGFDSHYGYWSGAIGYYDHIYQENGLVPPYTHKFSGLDLRRNYKPDYEATGQYATDLFTKEAINIINSHPPNKPLFLYLPHLAPHAGNDGKLLEAPQDVIDKFSHIPDPNRRTYAAMVYKLDQSIGEVIDALDRKNMLNNSIVVFLSDNGARNEGQYNNFGSNFPFRGHKGTLWEGGVRVPAVVWSPLIKNPSRVSQNLMHITDWFPTLLNAAGYKADEKHLQSIDGVDQWQAISQSAPNPREYLVVEIDPFFNAASIVIHDYKYILGPTRPKDKVTGSNFFNVHAVTAGLRLTSYNIEELQRSPAWKALQKYSNNLNLLEKIPQLRKEATILCNQNLANTPDCKSTPCFFNLKTDPCEQDNVASSYPQLMDYTKDLIKYYVKTCVAGPPLVRHKEANPELFNNTWSIWVV